MNEDESSEVTRLQARAPDYLCDVCGGGLNVRHIAIPEVWSNPDTGRWVDLLTWHECFLCDYCARPDGGLVSAACWDGWVAYRLGHWSAHPGRIVFVPKQNRSFLQ